MRPSSWSAALALPPRGALAKTDPDDPLDFYYRPLTAWVYRARLRLALGLLGEGAFDSLLEVAYGSGILLPELSLRATSVAAIDIHQKRDEVASNLERLGVRVELYQASIFEMPFGADSFDALVCLSVLEHLTELDEAFEEFARVLRPGAIAVIGFPVRNPVTDRAFRLLGFDPREIHPASHTDIVEAAQRNRDLLVERCAQIPVLVPRSLAAYVVCRLVLR